MGAGPLLIPHSHALSTASRNCLVAVVSCYAQHAQDQKQHLQPAEYSSRRPDSPELPVIGSTEPACAPAANQGGAGTPPRSRRTAHHRRQDTPSRVPIADAADASTIVNCCAPSLRARLCRDCPGTSNSSSAATARVQPDSLRKTTATNPGSATRNGNRPLSGVSADHGLPDSQRRRIGLQHPGQLLRFGPDSYSE